MKCTHTRGGTVPLTTRLQRRTWMECGQHSVTGDHERRHEYSVQSPASTAQSTRGRLSPNHRRRRARLPRPSQRAPQPRRPQSRCPHRAAAGGGWLAASPLAQRAGGRARSLCGGARGTSACPREARQLRGRRRVELERGGEGGERSGLGAAAQLRGEGGREHEVGVDRVGRVRKVEAERAVKHEPHDELLE